MIRLLGARTDVPDLITAADVVVIPSRVEGLPGAVLEAMALERPVIASDIPMVREAIGDDAYALVAVDDVAGFAAAIDRALDDPERARRRCSRPDALRDPLHARRRRRRASSGSTSRRWKPRGGGGGRRPDGRCPSARSARGDQPEFRGRPFDDRLGPRDVAGLVVAVHDVDRLPDGPLDDLDHLAER